MYDGRQRTAERTSLFYLDRRLNELEQHFVDHEELAKNEVSYGERRAIVARTEQEIEKDKSEHEALQWTRALVLDA